MSRLPWGSGSAAGLRATNVAGEKRVAQQNGQEPQRLFISSHTREERHQGLFFQREVLAVAPFGP